MPSYHITWEIDIDADSPREAAEEAQRIQRDPTSLATVFTVHEEEADEAVQVDLLTEMPDTRDYGPASDVPPTTPDDAEWTPW